jgi:hypothetical protein
MKKTTLKTVGSLLAIGIMTWGSLAEAQPTKAQIKGMSMPRSSYNITKDLAYPGDYGYYYLGSTSALSTTADLSNGSYWNWVRYKNPGNVRNIWSWASLSDPGVCSHGHISYGLWGRYAIKVGGTTFRGWVWVGGGTKSGDTNSNGSCVWDVDNSFEDTFGEDFGWGDMYTNLDITQSSSILKYTEFVLGSIAVSHGGYCV